MCVGEWVDGWVGGGGWGGSMGEGDLRPPRRPVICKSHEL